MICFYPCHILSKLMYKLDFDFIGEEPYLTVTDFQFVGYSGLPDDFFRLQSATTPDYQSGSKTSEIDSASMTIPAIDYNSNNINSSREIDFLTKVEGLDFVGSADGMNVEVVYILQVGDEFIVINNCTLEIHRTLQVERSPKLNFTLEFVELYTIDTE